LNGKPLLAWTIGAALKSSSITRLIVSTEDEEIAKISLQYGAEVYKRPKKLALDNTPGIDAIMYTLEVLKCENYIPDMVSILQCTCPLRNSKHIDDAAGLFIDNFEKADSLVSITPLEHPIQWVRRVNSSGFLENIDGYNMKKEHQRQCFEKLYRLNGAIYMIKTQKLYEHGYFQTDKTIPYVMDNVYSVDIDNEEDIFTASALLDKFTDDKII
jgi:CMP-N,N'-diacetyllegionaminic acid synthase